MAATVNMKVDMNASNEVPVKESKGTGVVTATHDMVTKKLPWKGTYSGLSGPATAAHSTPASQVRTAPRDPVFQGADAKARSRASSPIPRRKPAGRRVVFQHWQIKGGEIRGQVTK